MGPIPAVVVAIITRIAMARTTTPMIMAVPTTTVAVEALRTLLPVEAPLLRRPTLVVARSREIVMEGKWSRFYFVW